jgi:hypothetical protein
MVCWLLVGVHATAAAAALQLAIMAMAFAPQVPDIIM